MKKGVPFLFIILLAVLGLIVKDFKNDTQNTIQSITATTADNVKTAKGLNRNPGKINYSKHARCRMECRHIDENEVKQVLRDGKINYNKSDFKGADCNKRYAVEAVSKDKQRLRIVFAPCGTEVTVVTCIDLNTEWECSCEGD